jgi:hypothetical protein
MMGVFQSGDYGRSDLVRMVLGRRNASVRPRAGSTAAGSDDQADIVPRLRARLHPNFAVLRLKQGI